MTKPEGEIVLKPCRWCDARPTDEDGQPNTIRAGVTGTSIYCFECGARGPQAPDTLQAIAAWNCRSPEGGGEETALRSVLQVQDVEVKAVIKKRFRALGLPTKDCVRGATEVLHALEQSGFVVVPRVPTRALLGDSK